MQGEVAKQIENFVKFPPRQKPASFNLDAVVTRDLEDAGSGRNDYRARRLVGTRPTHALGARIRIEAGPCG